MHDGLGIMTGVTGQFGSSGGTVLVMICRHASVMQSVTVSQIGLIGIDVYVKQEPSSAGGPGGAAVTEGDGPVLL